MASGSKPVVLVVGRLSGPKNRVIVNTLKFAAPEVVKVFPQAQFQVIGSPVQAEHRHLEKQHGFIRFYGHQPDLRSFYEDATIVVGAGRVALEAMALKKAVVAIGERLYVGPILAEVIEQAKATNFGDCFEKEVFDWPRMSQDIVRLLHNDRLREQVALTGYELAQSEYDLQKIYLQIEAVYQQAVLKNNLARKYEIPVLQYHRVVAEIPGKSRFNIYVTRADFEKQLAVLKRHSFTPITFSDFLSRRLPQKPIILTFDDGYADHYHIAFPLLKKYGLKAVIYILGNRNITSNCWDVPLGEPEVPLLKPEQIREMAESGLVDFGGHSMDHRNLIALSTTEMEREIVDSKKSIEEMIGQPVASFAYPYGSYNGKVKECTAAAGYIFGVASDRGPARFGADLFAIRRIPIFPHTSYWQFRKKTSGYYLRYRTLLGK